MTIETLKQELVELQEALKNKKEQLKNTPDYKQSPEWQKLKAKQKENEAITQKLWSMQSILPTGRTHNEG